MVVESERGDSGGVIEEGGGVVSLVGSGLKWRSASIGGVEMAEGV